MQKSFLLLILLVLAASCNQNTRQVQDENPAEEQVKLIAAKIPELLETPGEYQDKEVAIEGMVTHVCRHGGQKCFVVAEDGETQIRIVPGGNIDEFKVEMEGSRVAIKGIFRVQTAQQNQEHIEDHEVQEHHDQEMGHSQAEKAEYYIEAKELQELNI